MRCSVFLLFALLLVLQYPLWLGRSGWLRVWEIEKTLQTQHANNQRLEQRNARIDAEVSDLKSGTDAIEGRARYDLGLVRRNEIFVRVPPKAEARQKAETAERVSPVLSASSGAK
jgi:cell division protein FtsB